MNLLIKEETMEEVAVGNYRSKGYWVVQNRQYAEPSFRLFKCARMLNELANGKPCGVLDLGCGPGALRSLLAPNLDYHGIDIALQGPAPFLRELDFARNAISYDGRHFDFIVALGVLEYMGALQEDKFLEILDILKPDGKFIMSYINFGHLGRRIWPNYNNVRPVSSMAESLNKVFRLERCFPASHHWRQKQPGRFALRKLQMHINFNIPVVSPLFAVEYFFVCSPKKARAGSTVPINKESAMSKQKTL